MSFLPTSINLILLRSKTPVEIMCERMCECCRSGDGLSGDAVVMVSAGRNWQPGFDFLCHFYGIVLVEADSILADGQV